VHISHLTTAKRSLAAWPIYPYLWKKAEAFRGEESVLLIEKEMVLISIFSYVMPL